MLKFWVHILTGSKQQKLYDRVSIDQYDIALDGVRTLSV